MVGLAGLNLNITSRCLSLLCRNLSLSVMGLTSLNLNIASTGFGLLGSNLGFSVVGLTSLNFEITGRSLGLLRSDLSFSVMSFTVLELDVSGASLGFLCGDLGLSVMGLTILKLYITSAGLCFLGLFSVSPMNMYPSGSHLQRSVLQCGGVLCLLDHVLKPLPSLLRFAPQCGVLSQRSRHLRHQPWLSWPASCQYGRDPLVRMYLGSLQQSVPPCDVWHLEEE